MKKTFTFGLLLSTALIASCGGGGGGSAAPAPTPAPPADSTAPSVSFSPTTLTVDSGATGSSTLSATDNVGVTSGPTVSCTNGGTFSVGSNEFTAPTVSAQTTSVCTATASDAAGNTGSATLTVTINPTADTTAPVVTFSPDTLTVQSGGTGSSTLTATDDVGVTTGPTVSCTNGASFSVASNQFTAPTVTAQTTSVCTATAEDAAGNSGSDTLTVTINPASSGNVTISGKITFDLVPFNTATSGLDYNNTTQSPARGIVVELLDGSGSILSTTNSDANGDYSFDVAQNTDVRVRAKAQMLSTGTASWDVRTIDNTNSNSLYAIQGSLTSSGTADSTRNLNAASGWGGASYTSTRGAAPFAILNPIYTTIQKVVAADPDVTLPRANFNWSVNNRAASGDLTAGEIGTSSYRGNGNIYILGDANSDTDEYDKHVVVHEWGHYFEDQMSRADSIGGQHSGNDRLDPRVAFGEGFGNALSAMMLDDEFYRDSFGAAQASGFSINIENNSVTNEGWFNESSVQSILYDIYDSRNDGSDNISLGFTPIYETLVDPDYTGIEYFTTIFAFINEFKANNSGAALVDPLLADQSINGTGVDGTGETNSGSISNALPVYKMATVNGASIQVCSIDDAGLYNKLGNREYVAFNVTNAGSHTVTVTFDAAASSATNRDPDFVVYKDGRGIFQGVSAPATTETASGNLTTGLHIIDFVDFRNDSRDTSGLRGDACFDLTITR